jgi:hypothetical protein
MVVREWLGYPFLKIRNILTLLINNHSFSAYGKKYFTITANLFFFGIHQLQSMDEKNYRTDQLFFVATITVTWMLLCSALQQGKVLIILACWQQKIIGSIVILKGFSQIL